MDFRSWPIAFLTIILGSTALAQSEDLSILSRWIKRSDAKNILHRHLNSLAFQLLKERREKIDLLKTAADWKQRQEAVKRTLLRIIGPFPPKTPLNPRVLGVIRKNGYRIEKVVFESRPNFYVTACLFLPENGQPKAPAILNVIGHTAIAFRAPSYQELILNLVKKGFIVLAIDPVGQGERLQYYDPAVRRSVIGGPTTEHSYFGKQCFISGSSAAHYFTWDGIRAIDYLVSRPEVDPDRIGVTGISGGGTQTSYIAALDDRVLAAAPTCYITGFQRLFESIGPQDAEQNFNNGLAHGIDHADLLEVRAPKPTLVVATTRDFFSIQGTRETVAEAKKAFEALGHADHLGIVEDDHGHGYTAKNREGIYAFFQKHLNLPGSSSDQKVDYLTLEELTVTPTGQLIDSLGGETVFSLNRTHAQDLLARLAGSRENLASHLEAVKTSAARLCGYIPPRESREATFHGRYQRDAYAVEMYSISGEGSCVIPFLLFLPKSGTKHPVAIYLHPEGKAAAASAGGEIEGFVKEGYAVLAPDLSGAGELGKVDSRTAFLGVQIARSIVGIQAADVIRCVQYLRLRPDIQGDQVVALARGGLAVPLTHAASFDPSISTVILVEPPISFRTVVNNRFYEFDFANAVPNALSAYDLPDLMASLAPRKLMIVSPQDQLLRPAGRELVDSELQIVRSAYLKAGVAGNLVIQHLEPHENLGEFFFMTEGVLKK